MELNIGGYSITRTQLGAVIGCQNQQTACDNSLTLFQRLTDALCLSNHRENIEKLWDSIRKGDANNPPTTELKDILEKIKGTCTAEQRTFLENNLRFVLYGGNYALHIHNRVFSSVRYKVGDVAGCMLPTVHYGHTAYQLPTQERAKEFLQQTSNTKSQADKILYITTQLNANGNAPFTQKCTARLSDDEKTALIDSLTQGENPHLFDVLTVTCHVSISLAGQTTKPLHKDADLRNFCLKGAQVYKSLEDAQTLNHEQTLTYRHHRIALLMYASLLTTSDASSEYTHNPMSHAWTLFNDTQNSERLKSARTNHQRWKELVNILVFDAEVILQQANKAPRGDGPYQFATKMDYIENADGLDKSDCDKLGAILPNTGSNHIVAQAMYTVTSPQSEAAGTAEEKSTQETESVASERYILEQDGRFGTDEQFSRYEALDAQQKSLFHLLRNACAGGFQIKQASALDDDMMINMLNKAQIACMRQSREYRQQVLNWAEKQRFSEYDLESGTKMTQEQRQAAIDLFLEGCGS